MVSTVERTRTALTVDGLLALNGTGREGELWEGEFVEVSPSGGPQGWIVRRLSPRVDEHASRLQIGEAWTAESGFILHLTSGIDTMLAPDISVVPIAYARRISRRHRGFHDVVPLLAIEVKSPTDEEKDISRKLALYLDAGIPEIWWLRPEGATVSRHWPNRDLVVHGPGDTIADVDLLPGFSIAVDDIFPPDEPDEDEEG